MSIPYCRKGGSVSHRPGIWLPMALKSIVCVDFMYSLFVQVEKGMIVVMWSFWEENKI